MRYEPYLRALAIGAVTGMRSMTGPAAARLHDRATNAGLIAGMALGELVVDKLPSVPARTAPASLAIRALAGGFAGSAMVGERGDRRIGFALGTAGAIGASYLALRLRRAAVERTGFPDAVVALVEDIAAVGAGLALAR